MQKKKTKGEIDLTLCISNQIHDDLEKEQDFSGSGFGPDDEDSSSPHHNVPSIKRPDNYSPNSGSSNHNNQHNKDTHDDSELGSGDDGRDVKEDKDAESFGEDDEDDDFTTEIKSPDIDSTTTDDEDSQCMHFLFILPFYKSHFMVFNPMLSVCGAGGFGMYCTHQSVF